MNTESYEEYSLIIYHLIFFFIFIFFQEFIVLHISHTVGVEQ